MPFPVGDGASVCPKVLAKKAKITAWGSHAMDKKLTGFCQLLGSGKAKSRGCACDDGHLLVRNLLCLIVGIGDGADFLAAALRCRHFSYSENGRGNMDGRRS